MVRTCQTPAVSACNLVRCVQDGGVALSDMEGALVARMTLPHPRHTPAAVVASSANERWLADAPPGSTVHVWEVLQQRLSHALRVCSNAAVLQLAFVLNQPDVLAILTDDSTLTLCNVATGACNAQLALQAPCDRFALDAAGNYCAAATATGALTFYDIGAARTQLNASSSGDSAESNMCVQRIAPHEMQPVAAVDACGHFDDSENTDTNARLPSQANEAAQQPDTACKDHSSQVLGIPAGGFGSTDAPVNLQRLKKLLNGCGEFPHRYRLTIWQHLLQLPLNAQAHELLRDKGTHPAAAALTSRC